VVSSIISLLDVILALPRLLKLPEVCLLAREGTRGIFKDVIRPSPGERGRDPPPSEGGNKMEVILGEELCDSELR